MAGTERWVRLFETINSGQLVPDVGSLLELQTNQWRSFHIHGEGPYLAIIHYANKPAPMQVVGAVGAFPVIVKSSRTIV